MSTNVTSLLDYARTEASARVRRWRYGAEFTQERAARTLGVSERRFRDWEAGKSRVPGWALVAIEQLDVRRAA